MKIEARKVNILNRIHVLDSLSPYIFIFLFLCLIMFVCMFQSISLSGLSIKATSHQFSFDFSNTMVRYVCVSASVRFHYETNHSCLCVGVPIKFLSHIFDTHLYSSGIFQVVYFIEHHSEYLSVECKKNLLQNVSFCHLVLFLFQINATGFAIIFSLISKSNTHVYICVRIRKMFASLRLSLYFGFSFFPFSILLSSIHVQCTSPIFNMLAYPFSWKLVSKSIEDDTKERSASVYIYNMRTYVDIAVCFVRFFALIIKSVFMLSTAHI